MKTIGPINVVIGAGPAGLAAGVELVDKGLKCCIIEKRNQVGGAGATIRKKDVFVDYGPHLFHTTNKQITELVQRFSHGGYLKGKMLPPKKSVIFMSINGVGLSSK